MKGRARRRIIWGAVALVILVALLFAWFGIFNAPREARIAWKYQPPAKSSASWFIYPRPAGGCFAINAAGQMYVLDAAGTLVKQQNLPNGMRLWKGFVDDQGVLYLGGSQGSVYAFNPDGTRLWECPIPDQCSLSSPPSKRKALPSGGTDGKLHVELNTGELAVLSRQGTIERRFDVGLNLSTLDPSAPAPNGGYYLVAWRKDVIRVSADGKVLWRYPTTGHSIGEIASSPDGTVYFVAHQDKFYALKPDGAKRWEYVNPDPIPANGFHFYSFTVAANGAVYISSGHHLVAFKPDGTQLWQHTFQGGCGDAISSGDKIYVQESLPSLHSWLDRQLRILSFRTRKTLPTAPGSSPQRLYVLDALTGRILKTMQLQGNVLLECAGANGELYGLSYSFVNTASSPGCAILRIDLD